MKKPLPACRRERGLFRAGQAENLSTETGLLAQCPILALHWWRGEAELTAVNSGAPPVEGLAA